MDLDTHTSGWDVDDRDFPASGTLDAQLRFALRYAVLAPSNHNTQPWRFVLDGESVHLCADRRRMLSVVDPFSRELVIGCGAAFFNLRVALSRFGLGYAIDLFPAKIDTDVIARLRVRQDVPVDASLVALFRALRQRVTTRLPFDAEPVAASLQQQLIDAGAAEGAGVVCIEARDMRERIANLIAEADRRQFADARFRSELASWTHARRKADGMPAYSGGVEALLDFALPLFRTAVRTFDIGDGIAATHRHLVDGSPLLVGISTARDDREAWFATGEALERMLLVAADAGLTASYLNQPIEVGMLREQAGALLGIEPGHVAQLLLRVGRGPAIEHTPRRPIDDVVW